MKNTFTIFLFLIAPTFCNGVNVTYYGAAGEVGGSLAVLEIGDLHYLVDVGSRYGEHPDGGKQTTSLVAQQKEDKLPFSAKSINAVILTHAHLDHTGRLPELYRKGFRGRVYATQPTKEILAVMLEMQIRYEKNRLRNWRWSKSYKKNRKDYFKAHWHQGCRWSKQIRDYNLATFRGTLYPLQKEHEKQNVTVSPCGECAQYELAPILTLFSTLPYQKKISISDNVYLTLLDAKHTVAERV